MEEIGEDRKKRGENESCYMKGLCIEDEGEQREMKKGVKREWDRGKEDRWEGKENREMGEKIRDEEMVKGENLWRKISGGRGNKRRMEWKREKEWKVGENGKKQAQEGEK